MKNFLLAILLYATGYVSGCSTLLPLEGHKDVRWHNLDTIPATLLVTHKSPSFAHSINGYCLYSGGKCIGQHIRVWRGKAFHIVKPNVVWKCERRVGR